MNVKQITPLITVDAVEPCLLFWTSLGFEVTAEVPHGEGIGFAMLARDGLVVMYQSRDSIESDLEASGAPAGFADEVASGTTLLFVEVDAIDEVLQTLDGSAEVVVPRRETFYGMDEIFLRAPCGTVVGFAARVEQDEDD